MKYQNKSEKAEYKMAFNQMNLGAIYEDAKSRMKSHPEHARRGREIVENCPTYESEEEAVEAALSLPQEDMRICKIWAEIEKVNGVYQVKSNRWILTYTSDTLKAAEYIGMTVMYDRVEFMQYKA